MSIPNVVNTSDRKGSISLDFVKQELDEKPNIEDENILEECEPRKLQNSSDESRDILDHSIYENGNVCNTDVFLAVWDVNGIHSVIKCGKGNENQSALPAKEEFSSVNEIYIVERNSAATQEASGDGSSISDRLMTGYKRVEKYSAPPNNASINKEISKYGENYQSDQLPNKNTLIVHDKEDFDSEVIIKEEGESIDIEENKVILNDLISNEDNTCINNTWKRDVIWIPSVIKCERDNENQSVLPVKEEFDYSVIKTCIVERNSAGAQEGPGHCSSSIDRLMIAGCKPVEEDSSPPNNVSTNKEFSKYEENYPSDDQLPNKSILLDHDQEHFDSELIIKEEGESIAIEGNKVILNHLITNEENMCLNNTWEWNTYTIKSKKTEDFDAENQPPTSFSNLEEENYSEKQIIYKTFDSKEEEHKCLHCNYSTLLKSNIQTHIDSVHLKLKNYKCRSCDYSASQKAVLRKHIDSDHLKLKNHKCHICDYTTSSEIRIQNHIDFVHPKGDNLKCHICSYSAPVKAILKRHIDSVHLKLKNHKCHLCDYSSPYKFSIRSHIESVHLKLKNHKCHLCDYRGSLATTLKKHINTVHLKLKKYKCPICDYSASLNSNLQIHIDSVHLKLKNYKCGSCDYNTTLKSVLRRHINSFHLKRNTHKCHTCDYSAATKSNLQTHINTVHLKLKNYKCHNCDFVAALKSNLQYHMDTAHSKVQNYKCHICGYSASLKAIIKRHVKSHSKQKP